MKVFYLEVTNMITTRAIKRLLHHQGIPSSTKLTEAQDKLQIMPIPKRSQISLIIAQNSSQAMN